MMYKGSTTKVALSPIPVAFDKGMDVPNYLIYPLAQVQTRRGEHTLNVVCDASTLIALARIGQLDILRQVGVHVVIPTAVYDEVVVKGSGKPGSDEMRQVSWIETRDVSDRDVVAQFRTVLGAGESEVIALAKERAGDLIILDDQDARETAVAEGLNVVGLLAFVVLAREDL